MEKYNKQDVVLLERLYDASLAWINKQHPNASVHSDSLVCPRCGGSHIHRNRGIAVLTTGKYERLHCQSCGHWFRSNEKIKDEDTSKERYLSL
jgi:hypothetical protein